MEKPIRKLTLIICCILLLITIYGAYFSTSKGEGFAIYLTQKDIPPTQMEAQSHIDLSDQPLISLRDIVTYNAQTHEMKLTSSSYERVSQLEVPVTGKSFIVCVDKEPIYWGAFWTPISSISFDGVTIWKPYPTQEPKIIVLELGYPFPSFYSGEDPRTNVKVLESIKNSGKLLTGLTLTSVDKLPHSMKGYEMYSWEEGGQWYFTLITGTNRIKTIDEITSAEDYISESGWVNIHVGGVDAINNVLTKLPGGESVIWLGESHLGESMGQINLLVPPGPIVDMIIEHAKTCRLVFSTSEN